MYGFGAFRVFKFWSFGVIFWGLGRLGFLSFGVFGAFEVLRFYGAVGFLGFRVLGFRGLTTLNPKP